MYRDGLYTVVRGSDIQRRGAYVRDEDEEDRNDNRELHRLRFANLTKIDLGTCLD